MWVGSNTKSAPKISKNGFTTNEIMARKAYTSCNQPTKSWPEKLLQLLAQKGWHVWVGSNTKSARNLSKNGSTTNEIMARTSCNHLCMNAIQDKQKSIGDEWAVIGIAGSDVMTITHVGRQ